MPERAEHRVVGDIMIPIGFFAPYRQYAEQRRSLDSLRSASKANAK